MRTPPTKPRKRRMMTIAVVIAVAFLIITSFVILDRPSAIAGATKSSIYNDDSSTILPTPAIHVTAQAADLLLNESDMPIGGWMMRQISACLPRVVSQHL